MHEHTVSSPGSYGTLGQKSLTRHKELHPILWNVYPSREAKRALAGEVKIVRISLPQDRQTRLNILFISAFILAALLFALVFFSISLYKHNQYGRFDLIIKGRSTLQYSPLFINKPSTIHPSASSNQMTTYRHLADGWGRNKPAYRTGGNDGLWFQIKPTITGQILINSPAAGTPLADILFQTRKSNMPLQDLVPGRWYTIKQYGRWFTLKFTWDN